MGNIADRVKKHIIDHLGVEPEKVVDTADLVDDLGADSLDQVEIVMIMEEEFGIEVPDDAFEDMVTVGDIVKFVEKHAVR